MTRPSIRYLVRRELGTVTHFCIYAVLEWVLIILLFINGIVAFLVSQFAKYCELRSPCLVCSRIDHIFAERDDDFHFNEAMCEVHMRDVSYLAYCHNHKKLSDIRKMCESCLLSFATEKESGGDTYKSLVGVLHKDVESFVEDPNQMHMSLGKNTTEDGLHMERSNIHRCCCCGMHLKLKNAGKGKNANQLLTATSVPSSSPPSRPPVELPFLRTDGLEEDKLKFRDDSKTSVSLGSEAVEGSSKSEADESIVHRLKMQVRWDRKSLMALYMELDEERNAAAIAANNAMAMITRLQADKAAVQMEALQYQRMMEEQAEYDQEALQETQKIIRDLENELEDYRHKFGNLDKDMTSQTPLVTTPSSSSSFSASEFIDNRNDDQVITNSLSVTSLQDFDGERSETLDHITTFPPVDDATANDELSQSSSDINDNNAQEETGSENPNKAFISRELSFLNERLQNLEANEGGDGAELLGEISENVQKLRQLVSKPEDT